MSKAYKTEAVARQQASKQHGKNWKEKWSILESDEGFEIVAALPENQAPEAELPETQAPETQADEPETDEPTETTGPSMTATLVDNMLNPDDVPAPPEAPKKEAEKTGKTIEPNRPEQNGLKRPSKGSTCCIIWDTCDQITSEKAATCTSAELFNALQGYNDCTLRTQYARWRQFNGITGRLPGQSKTAKLPPEFQDALDTLESFIHPEGVDSLKACKTPNELVAWIASAANYFPQPGE